MTNTQTNAVEAADTLVADLYRAAAGELPLGEPLAALRTLFGAWGVHLHGVRVATGGVAFSYEVGGFPPEGVLAYIREYHIGPFGLAVSAATISAGSEHGCGVSAAGQGVCWGVGTSGQLGQGVAASSTRAVLVRRPM